MLPHSIYLVANNEGIAESKLDIDPVRERTWHLVSKPQEQMVQTKLLEGSSVTGDQGR